MVSEELNQDAKMLGAFQLKTQSSAERILGANTGLVVLRIARGCSLMLAY